MFRDLGCRPRSTPDEVESLLQKALVKMIAAARNNNEQQSFWMV